MNVRDLISALAALDTEAEVLFWKGDSLRPFDEGQLHIGHDVATDDGQEFRIAGPEDERDKRRRGLILETVTEVKHL